MVYKLQAASLSFSQKSVGKNPQGGRNPWGGTPLYGLYRYVQPQRVWFFSRFGHKLGIDFSHFAAILVINRVSIFAL